MDGSTEEKMKTPLIQHGLSRELAYSYGWSIETKKDEREEVSYFSKREGLRTPWIPELKTGWKIPLMAREV